MQRILVPLIAVAVLLAAGVVGAALTLVSPEDEQASQGQAATAIPTAAEVAAVAADLGPIEVHRSESCGCCSGHVDHLRDAGFEIDERVHADDAVVPAMKHDLQIPEELWSCHTTVVDGYAIEGHVPADVIVTLLEQGWDVDGVALPGMPTGSPGMPGDQTETWAFPTFADGVTTEILTER